jgi:hypothetical protein
MLYLPISLPCRGDLGLSGKVRDDTKAIASRYADCVYSIGAVDRRRSNAEKIQLIREAYR